MPGKKKNPKEGAGLQIGGNVSVTHGDIVAGDKNIKVDKGGVIVGGHVQGSNIVTGDRNQIGDKQAEQEAFFDELLKRIDQRPNTSPEDKEDLKANIVEIKAEVEKGEQADETFLSRRLRNIARMAPDIGEVMLATLTNPAAGFATLIRKVAERAKASARA
jgi:hypothetical protein